MPNAISNAVSVLGGAAIGAVAMYLLDPDNGADRRDDLGGSAADAASATHRAVRSTASATADSAHSVAATIAQHAKDLAARVGGGVSDATESTRGYASDAAGSVSDSAHSVAARIAKYAKQLAGHVSGHVSDAADSLSDATDSARSSVRSAHKQTKARLADAADSAQSYGTGLFNRAKAAPSGWLDTASGYADQAKLRARRALGEPEPSSHVVGITAGSIGVLAVGVGLMYYLDPERGRTRRALLRDKVYSVTRQSGNKVRRYGHHLGNKAHGYAAQARQVVPGQWVDTAQSMVGATDDPQAD